MAVSGIALVTAAAARHIPPQRGPAAADLAPACVTAAGRRTGHWRSWAQTHPSVPQTQTRRLAYSAFHSDHILYNLISKLDQNGSIIMNNEIFVFGPQFHSQIIFLRWYIKCHEYNLGFGMQNYL